MSLDLQSNPRVQFFSRSVCLEPNTPLQQDLPKLNPLPLENTSSLKQSFHCLTAQSIPHCKPHQLDVDNIKVGDIHHRKLVDLTPLASNSFRKSAEFESHSNQARNTMLECPSMKSIYLDATGTLKSNRGLQSSPLNGRSKREAFVASSRRVLKRQNGLDYGLSALPTPSSDTTHSKEDNLHGFKSKTSSLSPLIPGHCLIRPPKDEFRQTTSLMVDEKRKGFSEGLHLSHSEKSWLFSSRKLEDCPNLDFVDSHNVDVCQRYACHRMRINVSGLQFEMGQQVLSRHPQTLLGDRNKWRQFYDANRKEVFFDRHRPSFEAIFFYYQYGGAVRRPYHIPSEIFLDELRFYQIESNVVEDYQRTEGYTLEVIILPSNPFLRKVWQLFEYPETSRAAFCVALISVLMTLLSIILFCCETLPVFSDSHCVTDEAPNFLDPFFIIETTCTIWFSLEFIARFVSCPEKLKFCRDFKNIVDALAVVPYYITLANVLSTMSCTTAKSSASLSFLRVIRLIRIFKLTKHSTGLQILLLTFKASFEGLGLFLVALFVSLLVFSSAIYYAEQDNADTHMHSIPDAFWWAIITMTTVGYGDKVPIGVVGKLIGAACAITGVLTLAIPVPIITGHFNRFYAHKTGRGRLG